MVVELARDADPLEREDDLGAKVVEAGEGYCTIEVPFSEDVTQQERYFHGAVIGAVGDNAGGYAALTLAPPDREVLTVEYKVNFLAPAFGEKQAGTSRSHSRILVKICVCLRASAASPPNFNPWCAS